MSFKEIIESEKEKIIKELRENGYSNKTVDYSQFLSLYEKYKELMGEQEFAYMLGLNYDKFRNLRTKGTKTVILIQKASEELKYEIRKSLRTQGYINRMIDYSEFLKLYEKYEKIITEKEFADIIGITYVRYRNIKNRGGKTKVLETKIDENGIREEINNEYGSILINYTKFLEMYKKYESRINNEVEFARIIGLTRDIFNNIKRGRED